MTELPVYNTDFSKQVGWFKIPWDWDSVPNGRVVKTEWGKGYTLFTKKHGYAVVLEE